MNQNRLISVTGGLAMHLPPPESNLPLEYWKRESEYQQSKARSGGLAFELLILLWYLIKGVFLLITLPLRLSISWRLEQRRKRKQKALARPPDFPI
jgi:hypothetical protein